jgi:hypothetical protein
MRSSSTQSNIVPTCGTLFQHNNQSSKYGFVICLDTDISDLKTSLSDFETAIKAVRECHPDRSDWSFVFNIRDLGDNDLGVEIALDIEQKTSSYQHWPLYDHFMPLDAITFMFQMRTHLHNTNSMRRVTINAVTEETLHRHWLGIINPNSDDHLDGGGGHGVHPMYTVSLDPSTGDSDVVVTPENTKYQNNISQDSYTECFPQIPLGDGNGDESGVCCASPPTWEQYDYKSLSMVLPETDFSYFQNPNTYTPTQHTPPRSYTKSPGGGLCKVFRSVCQVYFPDHDTKTD